MLVSILEKDINRTKDYGSRYRSYLANKMFDDYQSYKMLRNFKSTLSSIRSQFDPISSLDFSKDGISKKIKDHRSRFMGFNERMSDGEIIAENIENELIQLGKTILASKIAEGQNSG